MRIGRVPSAQWAYRDADLAAAPALRALRRQRARHPGGRRWSVLVYGQPLMSAVATGPTPIQADRANPGVVDAVQCRAATGAAETRGPAIRCPARQHPARRIAAVAAYSHAISKRLQAAAVIEVTARHRRGASARAGPALHSHQTKIRVGASSMIACGTKRALSRVIRLLSSRMPMPQAWSPTIQLPISG